jgi:menaquinone-dependent protoporphyrinogen oxidase
MSVKPSKISRRRFLAATGVTLAAAALACGGGGALATLPPQIRFSEKHTEGTQGMKKVLVAYASKAGSTGEVAEAIGKTLAAAGATVDVAQIKNVKDLSGYQAVILGSAIRMGQMLPEAVTFVKTHQADLRQRPVAYFVVSGFLREDTPEMRQKVADFLEPVRAVVAPASVGLFAGKMDFSKLSFLDRTIAKAVGSPEGDWRNWNAIDAWASVALPG